MESRNYITVSELNFYLNRIIDAEELLHDMYLMGEVSGVSLSKGNMYCTLKDEGAQIAVCCFGYERTYLPEAGEKVLMFGSPDFYTKTGKMSFVARRIEPFGKGKLHAELEELKKRLAEEGLFSDTHKKAAPRFALKVCVVTSINGAVIKDIYTTVRRYNKLIDIAVVDVQVQGKYAVKEIVEGLKLADRGGFDAVILARGGGSFEDLMPFNSEEVVRTLYDMDTYVISAVGHETDYTLADFAADSRALTPTAAAEAIAFDTASLISDVVNELKVASRRLELRITARRERAIGLIRSIMYTIGDDLTKTSSKVELLTARARAAAEKRFASSEKACDLALHKLSALNPANLLRSGYFRAERNGAPVTAVSGLNAGEKIRLIASDGSADAEILAVYPGVPDLTEINNKDTGDLT